MDVVDRRSVSCDALEFGGALRSVGRAERIIFGSLCGHKDLGNGSRGSGRPNQKWKSRVRLACG